MSDPIYLLIVDDEQFFRDTLENYFSTCEDITVVATADNGAHALQVLEKTMADVVLCDVRMPLLDGVEFTRTVAERNLPCNILALTSFNDDQAMLSMLQSGAFGFLLKNTGRDDIITAVREAAVGETTISPEVATGLRKYLAQPTVSTEGLPVREREVLTLLHRGKSNAGIAEELDVSAVSVKKAVSRLMQRFNVASRLELVATTRLTTP